MQKTSLEVQDYINSEINTFIEPLVYNLVLNRPANPIQFAIDWLTKFDKKKRLQSGHSLSSEDSDSQLNDQVKVLEQKIKKKRFDPIHKRSRSAISQEVFGVYNFRDEFELKGDIKLLEEEMGLVKNLLKNNILFQNMDEKDEEIILRGITIQQAEEYQLIIKEGQYGQNFYIVASGEYDCYQLVQDSNVFVKTYVRGDCFGELSLLYNAPRAASIVTKQPGKLLILDRQIFSQIIKVAAMRKQAIIESALQKVQILSMIPKDQILNIIGALRQQRFDEGQYVIKEGQKGDKMYIVLQGLLIAEKNNTENGTKVVYNYEEGDYFGELALLNDQPRQANIRVKSTCKLASLTRQGLKRIFGNLQQLLKQKANSYHE